MLRLRRTSLAVLALAITATVLAACGSDSSGSDDNAATVMAQTFGGSKSIKSGQLGLTLAMKSTDGLNGITGSYKFDQYNNPIKSAAIMKLEGGKEVFSEMF